MRKHKAHLVSLGCAKNLVDSEIMLGALAQAGYVICAEPDNVDVIIVNTCGFVHDAVDESESVILDMVKLKRLGLCKRLVVAGCLAEREKHALKEKFPEIDYLLGTSAYTEIVKVLSDGAGLEMFPPKESMPDHTMARLPSTPPWTAYLRTAEGCDNRCAYCMIPSLRGGYRSRTPESLEKEGRALAALGVKELVLVAQDNTMYGRDLNPKATLAELLKRLEQIDGIEWIRVMYCHPARMDRELLETMAASPRILNYLDIPMQHASPEILKAMNRPDKPDEVLKTIELARSLMPDVCIRTTYIVGFPGETEKHFHELEEFIKKARFDHLGVFRYSQESGTPAAIMDGQISEPVKAERYDRLMLLQRGISIEKNHAWVGREMNVLIESFTQTRGIMCGRSFRDAPDIDGNVFVSSKNARPGEFVVAKIREALEYDLMADSLPQRKSGRN